MGPTAIGKTNLAIEFAKRVDVALISVDSAMVYRGMDIGTAKPSRDELRDFPHALVNIRDPEDGYSVKSFLDGADSAVLQAIAEKKTPVLVGGTMMYFKAFRDGISELPEANPELREAIRNEIRERGVSTVYAELTRIDPSAARNIHPNNIQRIERALEVYRLTGQSISDQWKRRKKRSIQERLRCDLKEIALIDIERGELHERIERRTDTMLEAGFEDEVRVLMHRHGLTARSQAIKSVGYQQMWRYLEARESEENEGSVRDSIVIATRQLARRQLVWLRNWETLDTALQMPADIIVDEMIRTCFSI